MSTQMVGNNGTRGVVKTEVLVFVVVWLALVAVGSAVFGSAGVAETPSVTAPK